ncbi:MAG TPA: hypothetical protein VGG63_16405 [Steroidobacteraceae bacterium]|jgi:hypothetical protein
MTAPPIGGLTTAQAARVMAVSVRSVERAIQILKSGIPELVEMAKRGDLKLGPAEIISRLPHDRQRELVAQGAAACRQLAAGRRASAGQNGVAELRDLIQRAADDIRKDWPEAALDCLGRALRLLGAP